MIEEEAFVNEQNEVVLGSDLQKIVQSDDGNKIMFNMKVRNTSQ